MWVCMWEDGKSNVTFSLSHSSTNWASLCRTMLTGIGSLWFDGSHLCFFRWNNFCHALTGYSSPLLWHLPPDDGRMWLLTCKLCISMSSCQDPSLAHTVSFACLCPMLPGNGELLNFSFDKLKNEALTSVSGPPIDVCIYRLLLNKKRMKISFWYRLGALKSQLWRYFCSLLCHFLRYQVALDFSFLIFWIPGVVSKHHSF